MGDAGPNWHSTVLRKSLECMRLWAESRYFAIFWVPACGSITPVECKSTCLWESNSYFWPQGIITAIHCKTLLHCNSGLVKAWECRTSHQSFHCRKEPGVKKVTEDCLSQLKDPKVLTELRTIEFLSSDPANFFLFYFCHFLSFTIGLCWHTLAVQHDLPNKH